ncbi:hypothetical protein GCM10023172_42390 [Hymenobacter ginsengisoli]|uniref:Prolyl 3,4-dihydroxylase TPA1/OFD1 N-terminal domain-containing protein n=1 Tax=Hymenobacter ginsengisoli TaxID=1051626 RepID=A0ABP8QU23_9BACT|nr:MULTISPECIES: cyclophane-containing peptide 2OG-Fe(II) oxygenase YhhC [unclassified Hymenobacter]MBO2033400.1 hypothetical protein [Hymenobacter sp. BT559]
MSPHLLDFTACPLTKQPFPYFCTPAMFTPEFEHEVRAWLEETQTWEFTRTDFYEQYEFSLLHLDVPPQLRELISPATICKLEADMAAMFQTESLELVGATIHKLTDGQRIGVHNDFIEDAESHRLIIQINEGWTPAHGGYLMLFNSASAQDVHQLVLPASNSAFGFEISPASYHAVSTVRDFARYTLVYTFKQRAKQHLAEQFTAYLASPFAVCDAELSVALAKSGQQRLCDTTGVTEEHYSIANCLYPTTTGAKGFAAGIDLTLVEVPELDRLASFYKEHDLEPISYDELITNRAGEKLHAAWQLLARAPTIHACMQALVKTIQVVRSPDPEIDVSYSHPDIPFSVFVSVGEDTSLISSLRVAESLLHEAMHLKLTLLEQEVEMIQPDSQGMYYSPWRDEKRPVRGVLHGMFVFAAVREFYQTIQRYGLPELGQDFSASREKAISEELGSLAYFPNVPDLTEAGSLLVNNLLMSAVGVKNLVP